jgi:hypothetical protein
VRPCSHDPPTERFAISPTDPSCSRRHHRLRLCHPRSGIRSLWSPAVSGTDSDDGRWSLHHTATVDEEEAMAWEREEPRQTQRTEMTACLHLERRIPRAMRLLGDLDRSVRLSSPLLKGCCNSMDVCVRLWLRRQPGKLLDRFVRQPGKSARASSQNLPASSEAQCCMSDPVVSFLESQGLQGTMGLLMQLELICGAADEPTRLSRASNSRPNVPYSEQPSPAAISSTVHISNSFSVRRRSLLHRWCLLTGLCHTLQSHSCCSFALFLRPFPARYHRSI